MVNVKTNRKIGLKLVLVALIVVFTATGCVDYGCNFQFSVIGENGRISAPEPEWEREDKSFFSFWSGKKATEKHPYIVEFIATPNSGYQVKEWTQNGEIVEDNKSNRFVVRITHYPIITVTITVEFEPIP